MQGWGLTISWFGCRVLRGGEAHLVRDLEGEIVRLRFGLGRRVQGSGSGVRVSGLSAEGSVLRVGFGGEVQVAGCRVQDVRWRVQDVQDVRWRVQDLPGRGVSRGW